MLIDEVRDILIDQGKPYVIENVIGAPLRDPIRLCGLNFGLRVYRHRLFECNVFILRMPHPAHNRWLGESIAKQGRKVNEGQYLTVCGNFGKASLGMEAMGIDWKMNIREVAQAIPPEYTRYIGLQMIEGVSK